MRWNSRVVWKIFFLSVFMLIRQTKLVYVSRNNNIVLLTEWRGTWNKNIVSRKAFSSLGYSNLMTEKTILKSILLPWMLDFLEFDGVGEIPWFCQFSISVVACHLEDGSCKHTSYYRNVHCMEMSNHYDRLASTKL